MSYERELLSNTILHPNTVDSELLLNNILHLKTVDSDGNSQRVLDRFSFDWIHECYINIHQ